MLLLYWDIFKRSAISSADAPRLQCGHKYTFATRSVQLSAAFANMTNCKVFLRGVDAPLTAALTSPIAFHGCLLHCQCRCIFSGVFL